MDKGIEKRGITRPEKKRPAKGKPGAQPRWTSGAKTLVGTAQSAQSRIWFTINNGVLAEMYFPDVDQANTRAVRFLITGADGFFSDELWDAEHKVEWLRPGVPGALVETRCKRGRYSMVKEILTDPERDVLLIRVRFIPAEGEKLRLFVSIDPHVGDEGANNLAWAGTYKGVPMLFAERRKLSLAVTAEPSFVSTSAGYIGSSDAYTCLSKGVPLANANTAGPGNVALAAEIDLSNSTQDAPAESSFLISVACGGEAAEAGQQARAGLLQNYQQTAALFARGWEQKQGEFLALEDLSGYRLDMYCVSTAVLHAHQSKRFPGGFVASLSLPWGFARTDTDVGGYHVVWPRDMVEAAMGMLAAGDARTARSTLFYLSCTQGEDGGWSQNMWLDGTPHWGAIQMDGIALPLLLADTLRRQDALDGYDPRPMMHAAGRFLLKHGPVTQQDRWEALPGFSPYTMAVQVAALLAAADCAESREAPDQAQFLRETADAWNDAVDELTYVRGTALAKKYGVEGYYLRMSPPRRIETREMGDLTILMPNRRARHRRHRAVDIVSPDALALVRFGLRAASDPRIVDTVKVIDGELQQEMRTGPGWTRSSQDGYGEHPDGQPYDGTGIGRCWPLLAGERGHFEIAAGRREVALHLLKTMSLQTSECGMIPEQVWDAPDLPSRELYNGHPTGSGMPLAWAHAEYIKLLRSLHEDAIWDAVPQARARYVDSTHPASFQIWRPRQRRRFVTAGKNLRLDLDVASRVVWTVSRASCQAETTDSGLGLHTVMLPTASLAPGTAVRVRLEPLDPKSEAKEDGFVFRIREGNGNGV